MLKVQLLHPSLPPLIVDPDPEGLEDLELAIKRSEDNDGLFYEFSLNLGFNKAARAFIHTVEDSEGIDGEITCNVYQYHPNTYRNEIIYTGQIKLSNFKIDETVVETNIEQSGFERDFANLSERDLDIESPTSHNGTPLPATPIQELEYHSKAILKRIDVSPTNEDESLFAGQAFFQFPACATPGGCSRNRSILLYGQIDGGDGKARELEDNFTYPWGFTEVEAGEIYTVKEVGLAEIDISVNLKHRVTADRQGGDVDVVGCGESDLGHLEIIAYFIHRGEDGSVKTNQQMGTEWAIPDCPGFTTFESAYELKTYQASNVSMEIGDEIFIYYTVRISATYSQSIFASSSTISHELGVQAIKETTFIRITQKTEFPATTSKSIMVYEAANKMCQYMTNQVDCFRSDFLGRTDTVIAYPEDGAGSLIAFSNGENIRGRDNIIFMNWVEFFQTISSIYCLGWGFELLENGTQIIRVEPKPYFYDKTTQVLNLGQVSELFRVQDRGRYYGVVEYGYPKMENINQINGIDEFNTRRKQSSPLSKTKGKLDIRSPWRASGFEIESQRRLLNSNEDSRLDSDNFIVTVIREGLGFKTESDELFSQINNVFDPETVYNARISPARNLKNWIKILGSNLIKGDKKEFIFNFGALNYEMTSQITGELLIAEDENLNCQNALDNNEVLYYPELYEFEAKFTKEQYELLKLNPRGYVTFKDWNLNEAEAFLSEVNYKLEENKGTFTMLRLYRKTTS